MRFRKPCISSCLHSVTAVTQWPYRTIVSSRRSSAAPGSSVRPVWTGDIWMIVLRGETSQWKRLRCGSAPIGPASAPPRQTARDRRRDWRAIASRSSVGSSAQQPRLVELDARLEEVACRARQDHADVDQLAALDARHDADDRVVVGVLSGHGWPPRRTRAARSAGRRR